MRIPWKWIPGIRKDSCFIAIPETNNAFNFLSSILFAIGFEVLTHKADDILQGKYLATVEKTFATFSLSSMSLHKLAVFQNFAQVLSSIRSREMSIKIIIQVVNQLESLYKVIGRPSLITVLLTYF